MKLTRRDMIGGAGALVLAGAGGTLASITNVPFAKAPTAKAKSGKSDLTVGDDGLYHQDWFVESFLDLRDDVKEAADNGKQFAILWEQRGCPYCREMHRVNFADPAARKYIQANFHILQLDLWGPRKVTDLDGKEMGERELAKRWGVNFTPTMNFYPKDVAAMSGKVGREAEVFRMPGYFKLFHFVSTFEYVRSGRTKDIGFQRFLQEKTEKLHEQGKDVDLWDKG